MEKKKKLSLAVMIALAMLAGIVVGAALWLAMGAKAADAFSTAYIKPIGDIFINLLKFIVVPVVLLSIIDGMISMKDIKKVGAIGWKTVAYFLCTTAIACVIGLAIANLFKPIFPILTMDSASAYEAAAAGGFMDTLKGIFPSNLWKALVDANMLQVIFIALMVGAGIIVAGEKGNMAAEVISSFNEVIMQVMMFIIKISPIGVFCLMTWVVSNQGPKILSSLAIVLAAAYVAYIIHAVAVYSLSVKLFANMNPLKFFKSIFPAFILAFTSTSSVAALPVSKECCDEMGCDKEISSFVLPLGATINMDGTAIYQCVAAIFLARCMNMSLGIQDMVLIVVTATLASIGTAGVSGAGMIMLAMVLEAIGIDPTYIGLIYGIDRLFDMGRTSLNVIGDASCAICVDTWETKRKARL